MSTKRNKDKVTKSINISDKSLSRAGLVIISVVFLFSYTRIFDYKLDMGGDNIVYYSLGSSLAQGNGYTNIMSFTESPHKHFPPGYPVIISLAIRAGVSLTGMKILNGMFLYLSCILLYILFYRTTRNVFVAFTVILFMATNQHLLRSATIIMSEIPFLFFSSAAILLFSYLLATERTGARYYFLLAGLSIFTVAAYYIRTAGIVLALAVALTLVIIPVVNVLKSKGHTVKEHLRLNKPRLLALLLFVVFFAGCKIPWDMRNERISANSVYMGSLTLQFGGTRIEGMSGWVERVKKNTTRYVTKEIPAALFCKTVNYDTPPTGKDWIAGIAILLLMAAGLTQLKQNDLLLLFYSGGTMAVLLLWPDIWFGTRFMQPLIPFLLFFFATGLLKAFGSLFSVMKVKSRKISLASLPVMALWLYPDYSQAMEIAHQAARFKEYTTANSSPQLAEFLEAIKWVKANLPDTARVSCRKPELFYLYSGGRKSSSFPRYATTGEVMDYLVKNNISYIIIDHWFRHAYATVIPAVNENAAKFRTVCQIGGANKEMPPTYVLEFNPRWGYTGDMRNGKPHGQGVFVMQDNQVFTGTFVDGAIDGYGVLTDANGKLVAKGIWKDNQLIKPE